MEVIDWEDEDRKRVTRSKVICVHCPGLEECNQEQAGYFLEGEETANGSIYYVIRKQCALKTEHERAMKIERLFKYAKIPKIFEADTWDDYEITEENKTAVSAGKWLENNHSGKGMLVYGGRGTGKTKMISIISKNKLRQGHKVLFSSVPDLMQTIRSSFDNGGTDEILEEIREVEVLVMDDLGAEKVTEWVGEQICSIVNHRMNKGLQTIVTTNYTPEQLIMRLSPQNKNGHVSDDSQGNRIVSRLYEMCYIVEMGGIDRRLSKACFN